MSTFNWIDQYNDPSNFDDEGNDIPWGIKEVFDDASKFEGIIITLDGQRHNIPIGGGIVRRPSAQAFGRWIDSCEPPEGMLAYLINNIIRPTFTDNIYQQNVLLYRLMQHKKRQQPVDPTMPEGLLYARYVSDARPN